MYISSIFEKQVSMKKVFADDRENYYLPLSRVKKIDKWLRENYLIDCYTDFETFFVARGKGTTHQERLKVEKLIKKYIGYFETDKFDSKEKIGLQLTNIYASDPWRAWWHSTRRAWLLDSLSFCSAIISDVSKKKESLQVIDVGCNVGIHSNYLAQNHRIELTGIDNSEVAIEVAQKIKNSKNAHFLNQSVNKLTSEYQWDVAIAVDFIQPNEHNFALMMGKIGDLVKPNGHLIVVGNFIEYENIDEYFRSIGFACLGAQLTGGYQQGHSEGFGVDWSTKAALHLVKNTKLNSISLPISGLMTDFATYANSGDFLPAELNRSYFLPRVADGTFVVN
jgi:2-polyprenyl-3-methyl-5-hydroxy-6-metoxy-1,4-benzoquinol methylase